MVRVRAGTEEDLDWILAEEERAYAAEFAGLDPRETHEAMLDEEGTRYLIAEKGGARAGYAIVRGIGSESRVLEIKRIVIASPGEGIGRFVLRHVITSAFDRWFAHRLWLDVYPENARARHVYQSLGFVEEGTLRDCVFLNGRQRSLIVMSMLEPEYRVRGRY